MVQTVESLHLRLSDLENKIQSFFARIIRYDSSIESIKPLGEKIQQVEGQLSQSEAKIRSDSADAMKYLHDKINVSSGVFAEQINNLKQSGKDLWASQGIFYDFITFAKAESAQIFAKLAELEKISQKFASSDSVKLIEIAIEGLDPKIALVAKGASEGFGVLSKSIEELKKIVPQLQNTVDVHTQGISSRSDEINALKLSQAQIFQQLSDKFTNGMVAASKEIRDKIAAIPPLELPSLDSVKAQLEKSMETTSLDARNANLRSQNLESKINLLEKRLEQLTLLIQKLQLAG